jgi:mono/diheme cytochrome c family protein
MRSLAWKLALAVPFALALGSIACATGGSQSKTAGDAATAAEREARASAAAPPTAQPAPPAVPTPAPSAAPAVAAVKPEPSTSSAPASGSTSPVAAYLADPQAMTRAAGLFRAVCTGYCHSTQPAANREAPNLFDCEWTHGSNDQEIFDTIAAGVPDTQMQGFGERLPHEDLWKLVAFIRQKSACR